MSERFAKLKKEFLALIPPTIFFFVALHIVALIRALMTKGTGIAPSSTMSQLSRCAERRTIRASSSGV